MRGVRYAMCVKVASDEKSAPQRDSLYLVYEHIKSSVTERLHMLGRAPGVLVEVDDIHLPWAMLELNAKDSAV